MPDELIGQKLGQYDIQMLLGKGGMSTVYLGHQPSMDRAVAIKVLPREFLHDDTFLARFQQEARVIARLEHLHILPVYDVGEDQGIPYIVMRYLQGGTLADIIDRSIPTLPTAVRFISQIADALDYAHEQGVIHRDLKPSNVLLDDLNNAFLADFGIARVVQKTASLTGSRIVGTPPYVAPDMVRKNEDVTHSVDVYALGIITYELLTGLPPYIDEDPMKVLMAHVLEPVPKIREVDPSVSTAVASVLKRCLAKTPVERYRTAGAFARAMQEAASVVADTIPAQPVEPNPDDDNSMTVRAASQRSRSLGAFPTPPSGTLRRPDLPEPPAEVEPEIFEPLPTGHGQYTGSLSPIDDTEELDEPDRRRGCLTAAVIITLVIAGIGLTAFALSGGDFASVVSQLDSLGIIDQGPTNTPQPTVTLTPQPPTPLSTGEAEGTADETPTPGTDKLAFSSNRDGDYEIYVIDADGSNLVQLTSNDTLDFDPDWSPDGKELVFASSLDGDPEIVVMSVRGSASRLLTDNEYRDADPAWSPDGQWIAFTSDRDGDFDIYLMRPDGTDVQQLTFNDREDLTPSWSPDSQQLVYYVKRTEEENATSELYALNVYGGGAPTRLTDNLWLDQWPDWSPDGTQLIFSSAQGLEDRQRTLFLYDVLDGSISQLTDALVHDDDPVWSPDGTRIAYDSNQDGDSNYDLFIYDIEAGTVTQLTTEAANDVAPAWQP